MKRFFITSFVALAILTGATGAAPTAHAQTPEATCAAQFSDTKSTAYLQCLTDAINPATPYDSTAIQSSNDAAMQAAQTAAAKTPTESTSGIGTAFGSIMSWIASLFAWLVGVAALTLDYAVYFTIIKMGDYVHNLTAIGITWRILRDIGNIALIFGFLAIGISIILNTERLGYGKKMLPMLLVAAVFINFSLFFTEAVIDVGNMFATQFFTQINGGVPPTADYLSKTTIGSEGISNKIMAQVGLANIYSQGQVNTKIFEAGNIWTIGFMSIILFTVTAFVMFSLAFILIARFVYLIFLIILAPLGFAGLAVPQLAGKAKWWWDSLFHQTITAPVLLLMLYIALAVITDTSFLTGLGAASPNAGSQLTWTGFIDGRLTGFGSLMLTFLVAMGLLILVTITAKSLSAFGSEGAMKLAGKLSFGATAWAGRTTVGWGANKGAKYLKSTSFGRIPLLGTGFVKGLDKVAGGSFDVRGMKTIGSLKDLGVDAGDAQKGDYKADLKARTESRTKYAADIKGKEFKDLSEDDQFELAQNQKELLRLEKVKKDAVNVDALRVADEAIKVKQREIEEFHKQKGTEVGNKIKYAEMLTGERIGIKPDSEFGKVVNFFNPAANTDAAKKIKEEAKKSKDDKDLESLKKMLKKVGGEDVPPVVPAAGDAPAGDVPAGGGH